MTDAILVKGGRIIDPAQGLDAVGDVTVRLRYENRIYSGRAADTDILVASAKAYTNAMNRLLALDGTEAVGTMEGV